MKNFKNLLMTFIGIIAVAMCATSCLNSDDDSIDAVTQNRYQKLMSGMYSGKARFYQLKSTRSFSSQKTYVKYDSIHTSWDVNADSTFRINNFPVFMPDSAIVVEKTSTGSDAEKYRALNQAIRALKNSSEGYIMGTKARYVIPSSWYSLTQLSAPSTSTELTTRYTSYSAHTLLELSRQPTASSRHSLH